MSLTTGSLRVNDYHLFEDRGHWHVLVVADSALYRVDEAARRVLTAIADQRGGAFDPDALGTGLSQEAQRALVGELTELGILDPARATHAHVQRDSLLPYAQPPLRTMTAMVTQSCNLSCGYCYADEGRFGGDGGPPMTFETARDAMDLLIREAGDAERVTYQFLGGEPLLSAPLIRRLVDYGEAAAAAAGKEMRFSLTTNGTLLTSAFTDFLLRHDITCTVSLDGPAEVNDLVRVNHAGKGSYARTIAACRRLITARPTRARVTVTKSYLDVSHIVEHLLGEGFAEVGVTPVNSTDPRYALTDEDRDIILGHFRRLVDRTVADAKSGRRFGFANLTELLKQVHEGRPSGHPCGAGISLFSVDAEGTIFPCHRFPGHAEYALGTVEGGLDREKQSQWLSQVHVHNRSACRSCWARYICSGGCYYLSAIEYGDVSETFTPICDHLRAWYQMGLAAYAELAESCPELLDTLGRR